MVPECFGALSSCMVGLITGQYCNIWIYKRVLCMGAERSAGLD